MIHLTGLFAGIGGIEHGFHRALGDAVKTDLLCESWSPAQAVLRSRFAGTELHPDVRELEELPAETDVLSAGFPCQDLSQAGQTAGIRGKQSGLVTHLFDLLRRRIAARRRLPLLLIENVPNMLSLDRGSAMEFLIQEIESLGYTWAYRVVDTRFTGLPQRRRRVILVASTELNPAEILFADESGDRSESEYVNNAFGFYWTEGRGGLGWAHDAVPTLKGGSTIGIASPPAIWLPDSEDATRAFIVPREDDMESLQGFPRGWTDLDFDLSPARRRGVRSKLLGNAVSVRVAEWVATRIVEPGEVVCPTAPWGARRSWPNAAMGGSGQRSRVEASEFPMLAAYEHLLDHVDPSGAPTLSLRAVAGFHSRLLSGNLGQYPGFREAVGEAERSLNEAKLLQLAEA